MIWSDTHARRWRSLTRKGNCRRRNVFLARASGVGPLPERRLHPPRLSPVWCASLDRRVVLRGDVRGGRVLRLQHGDGCSAALCNSRCRNGSRTLARAAREALALGMAVQLPDRAELREGRHGNRCRAIQVRDRVIDPPAQAGNVETVRRVIAVGRDRVRATV